MERTETSKLFPIGSPLPQFSLQSTDGQMITDKYLRGAPVSLVFFSCNHCPYVKGSEELLIGTVNEFARDGLKAISISSNDPVQYPDDGFEKMKQKSKNMALPYPYLFDSTQQVAKLFDAQCTPECYLFNHESKLVYHGPVNDNPRDPSKVTKHYLAMAIAQTLQGIKPDPSEINSIGCSIKWKIK